jgi:uncharacterized metal-binding protein YceD (DUF177 family)
MGDSPVLPRHVVRLSESGHRRELPFALRPSAPERQAVAAELGILGVERLAFEGRLRPEGRQDWRLEGRLSASVVQECVVTLDPVTSGIEEEVVRAYVADLPDPGPGEVEMPGDELEPLPAALDLAEVMIEALALALPPYPRAPGVELGETVVTQPGAEPLTEERAKPFAALRDTLKRD